MRSEAEVRSEVDAHLYRPLTDREWNFLKNHDYVADIIEHGPDQALEQIRRMRDTYLNPDGYLLANPKAQENSPRDSGERVRALSALFAAEAADNNSVITFRREILGDELLDWDEVAAFIGRQRALEDEMQKIAIVKMAVPASDEIDLGADQQVSGRMIGLESLLLAYGVPGEDCAYFVRVRFGGTLHRLKVICEDLARSFLWSEAQACVFVLTGATPVVPRMRCTLTHSAPAYRSRITLSVDPTVPPKELADHYRSIRKGFLGGRYRSPSPKHLRLAAFMASRNESETWADRLTAWNEECEASETYEPDKQKTFARDCRVAVRRLLEPRIKGTDLE